MTLREEVTSSLYGAWQIAWLDPAAMRYFNLSVEGFWRSFLAPAMVAPFYLVQSAMMATDAAALHFADDPLGFAALDLLTFAVNVAAFPLVMIPVARLLDLSATYVPFIIASNWAIVLVALVMIPATLIVQGQALGPQVSAIVYIMAFGAALFYTYLVVRTGLGCKLSAAIFVLVLDFLLGLVINRGFEVLFYADMPLPDGSG